MTLSPLESKLVEEIKKDAMLSNDQYAKILKSTKGTIAGALQKLRDKGVVEKLTGPKNKARSIVLTGLKQDFEGVIAECEVAGIPPGSVNHGWYKGEHWSLHFKGEQKSYFEIRDDIIADMKEYSPVYAAIKYKVNKDAHLLVIDPCDLHIGKLCSAFETGEEYDSQTAVKRVREGVQGILNKSQGFKIDNILFIIGNDILHVDTPRSTTTSGTPQDTCGMWYDNFLIAKRIYVELIESLLQVAPVHVQYDPSNHDFMNGFFLADSVLSWFSKCKGVTFNVSMAHRKYYQYGKNLIGTTHGNGAKTTDLPLLMAQEASHYWHESIHRYMYVHHIHHKMSKDFGSVCVEALRSASGTDGWHHRNGYQHSPKAIEGYIHCKTHGQIARFTHIF